VFLLLILLTENEISVTIQIMTCFFSYLLVYLWSLQ